MNSSRSEDATTTATTSDVPFERTIEIQLKSKEKKKRRKRLREGEENHVLPNAPIA